MLWDPFLIKKLLKSVICGTREQCTDALFTVDKVNYCRLKKKKRKEKNVEEKRRRQNHCNPNGHLVLKFIKIFVLWNEFSLTRNFFFFFRFFPLGFSPPHTFPLFSSLSLFSFNLFPLLFFLHPHTYSHLFIY